MRKFIAYIIMMITTLSFIIFNAQSIFDNVKNAAEFGKASEFSFAITQREKSTYPTDIYGDNYYENITTLDQIDVKSKISDRLELAGIRNAEVELINADQNNKGMRVNVKFSPISDVEKENLKTILLKDGSLALTTAGNSHQYMQSKNEFFATNGRIARVEYNGTVPFISLSIKNGTDFDAIKSDAENAGDKYDEMAKASEENNNDNSDENKEDEEKVEYKKSLYLWSNLTAKPTLEDTYEKAFGLNDQKVDDECANKVLGVLSVDDYSYDNKAIAIRVDKTGNEFTISKARALANAINAVDYGFDIEFLYENSTNANFGARGITTAYLVFGIFLIIVSLVMIAIYGVSGLTSSITMVLSLLVSILMFNLIGFEFTVSSIVALLVLSALSILFSVNYFEHTKNFFKKGSNIEKASRDGFKNSFMLSLDAFLVVLIISLFSFLLSINSFKTFFGVLMIGSIFTFIITMFLNKWLTYWLVKDKKDNMFPYFSLIKNSKRDLKIKKIHTNKPELKFLKPIFGILTVLTIIFGAAIPSYFVSSNGHAAPYFNASDSFGDKYVLNITFNESLNKNSELTVADDYINFIKETGSNSSYLVRDKFTCSDYSSDEKTTFKYNSDSAKLIIETKINQETEETYYIQYFSMEVDKDLNTIFVDGRSIAEVIDYSFRNDRFDVSSTAGITKYVYPSGDSNLDMTTFVSNCYKLEPVNLNKYSSNFILVLLLSSLFATIYFLIRFGIISALVQLVSSTIYSSLGFGLLVLLGVPFTSFVSFGVFASIILFNLTILTFANKYAKLNKERGSKLLTPENRLDLLNESFYLVFETISVTLLVSFILSIPFMIINKALASLSLYTMLMIVIIPFIMYLVYLPLFFIFSNRIKFTKIKNFLKNRNVKIKDKEKDLIKANNDVIYVDQDGPHETIIMGVNEFRR